VNKDVSKRRLRRTDDAVELAKDWFAKVELRKGAKLVRRWRPAGSGMKELISLGLDKSAKAAFRATGRGWQVRINESAVLSAKRLGAEV
jgi:uncharacterized protein (DUF4415 family)